MKRTFIKNFFRALFKGVLAVKIECAYLFAETRFGYLLYLTAVLLAPFALLINSNTLIIQILKSVISLLVLVPFITSVNLLGAMQVPAFFAWACKLLPREYIVDRIGNTYALRTAIKMTVPIMVVTVTIIVAQLAEVTLLQYYCELSSTNEVELAKIVFDKNEFSGLDQDERIKMFEDLRKSIYKPDHQGIYSRVVDRVFDYMCGSSDPEAHSTKYHNTSPPNPEPGQNNSSDSSAGPNPEQEGGGSCNK